MSDPTRHHKSAGLSDKQLGRPDGFVRRHKIACSSLLALVFVAAFAGWLAAEVLHAKSSLEQARTSAQSAKDALMQGKSKDASAAAADARIHAVDAQEAAHSLPWTVASNVPWLGSPLKAAQQMSDVVAGLAVDVLQPSAKVGAAVSPDQLLRTDHLDVQLLRAEEPALKAIAMAASRLEGDARSITNPRFPAVLSAARTTLQTQTSDLAKLLRNTALAARVAPSLMGADGPRTYFMGFQTNAEARGTGGLLGGFGIVHFDNGTTNIDTLGQNIQLDKEFTPLDLGPEYGDQYGFMNPSTDFRNSNFSPHFPYAAQIWRDMWAQQTGEVVDGVIAIDPVALSYVLGVTGPVTMPDGEVITNANVVDLTESTAYQRFPRSEDQGARKAYLQGVAREVVKKITAPTQSPRALLEALGKAVSEGRISVWSANPTEQSLLEGSPLAHTVPDDGAPYASVVINNLAGNKMDYYLKRTIDYTADGCSAANRNSSVKVRLESSAPPELPDYVGGTSGLISSAPITVPNGSMISSVRLVATKGATLRSVTANEQRVPVFRGVERGHPTFEVQVVIPPGKSGELVFNLTEPSSTGAARVPVQPLVDPLRPTVSVPECTH